MEPRLRFLAVVTLVLTVAFTLLEPPEARGETARPKIVAFGDSLTAGLGVSREQAYPAQLGKRLTEEGLDYTVVNAGVSGDTTAGGVRRVEWILKSRPKLVIVELGANDGLRGLSLTQTRENLAMILQKLTDANVQVVLAGMKLPPNYGKEYTAGFEQLFPDLARQFQVPLIGFLLDGVAARPKLNQADGIHPTEEGYRIVAETVYRTIRPLLKEPLEPADRPNSES